MGVEGQKRIEVITMDFPDDVRSVLNTKILGIINELPLNVDGGLITVSAEDLEQVIAFVKSEIPNALMMKSLDGSWLRISPRAEAIQPIPVPEVQLPSTSSDSDEKVGEYYQDYRETPDRWRNPDWPNLVAEAKKRAIIASKPKGSRKYVPEIIKTYQEKFTYKGNSTSVYKDSDPKKGLKSVTELRKWKRGIDKKRR